MDTARPLAERLEFTTVVGAEDLLRESVAARPEVSDLHLHPGRVDCHWDGPIAGVWELHLAHQVQVRVREPDLMASLRSSRESGVLSLVPDEPPRFRVGAESAEQRAETIALVESALGWRNDVSNWHVNLTAVGPDWVIDIGGLHWNARHFKLERQSFSTPTTVAMVLARLSKLERGSTVLDPFCGAGTILVAVGYLDPDSLVRGVDCAGPPLELAAHNLQRARGDAYGRTVELTMGRAEELPFADGAVPRVVANMPFGKRVGSHEENQALYPAFLRELARVMPAKGRAVLLTEDKRLFTDSVARTGGIKIASERVLRYGGATPSCFSVVRSRR